MKFIKRLFLVILFLVAIGLLFRGWLYRHLVTYRSIGQRTTYSVTDARLIEYINENTDKAIDNNIEQVVKTGLSITSKQLNFTAAKNDVDPNKLITSKSAHCVGYAAFFAATCNHLLSKYNLTHTWTAKPQVGQLYFFGTNIHKYVNTAFFKDHDFVIIENKKTGEVYAVDLQ
ncbi:hypothetical protein [Hymenobacter sediminis]|uniref:hypothetical protein n=1 Tax=Hymenobacter sediminis TaxID=2218621 RepID=UPI000DA6CCC0|nr:hypothetical protein [Hymenobacter sediminis]